MPAKKKKQNPINLLPQNDFERTTMGRILKWILSTFRIIVIFVELVVIISFLSRFWLDIEHSDLNDEIEAKSSLIESYLPFEKQFKATQKKLEILSSATSPELSTLTTLENVNQKLPEDVFLTSLTKASDNVEIEGTSLTEQSIAQFITNLKVDPELESISLTNLENNASDPLIHFTLETKSPAIPEEEENS